MNQEILKQKLKAKANLSDNAIERFLELAIYKQLRKNEFLIRQGEQPVYLTLIQTGCLMTYLLDTNKHPFVLQFGQELWWTGDLEGLLKDTPSIYNIKAVVESEVYLFDKQAFEQITAGCLDFERYFRVIFQNSLISHQKRILRNITHTAEENYQAFTTIFPKLELIVPQKYIASYLGITPEFLSKLRRRLAGK